MEGKLNNKTIKDVMSDESFMRLALQEAKQAFKQGEIPIGAVVVENGEVIGRSFNSTITLQDPTAHAEIIALQRAAKHKGSYRLPKVTLYITTEPCLMCLGAALHARVKRIVYGTEEPKFGAVKSLINFSQLKGLNHKPEIVSGILADECSTILKDFFQQKR
jgi:tRNA(adenine34) deaminase